MKLKKWLERILEGEMIVYTMFIATTIESIGNTIYDNILIVFTIITFISYYLLNKYTKVFDKF